MRPALALAALIALPAQAQTPLHASALGSDWAYFRYETGANLGTILTGQPSMHEGPRSVVLTMVSRDGRALTESDRADAARVAAALCRPGGYAFNTTSRGSWMSQGWLSFDGDCNR